MDEIKCGPEQYVFFSIYVNTSVLFMRTYVVMTVQVDEWHHS